MLKDLISVIIPIYNASKYLNKCLESLISQTYKKIEIILIDDGSNDDSFNICKEYEKKDDRIIVVHQKNKGVSAARNLGLKLAKGKYISFVDADDFIDKRMFELLIGQMKKDNSQIAICNISYELENGKIKYNYSEKDFVFSSTEFPYYIYNKLSINGFVCNKIYDRNLIYKNNSFIKFNEEIKISEDSLFNYEIYNQNESFFCSYIDKKLYHYIQYKNSACNQKFNTKKLQHFIAREKEINILERKRYNSTFLKIDYVISFTKINIITKMLKIKETELFNRIKEKNNHYIKTIKLLNIPYKLKIKYMIAKYFPFIYKLKIIIQKENI